MSDITTTTPETSETGTPPPRPERHRFWTRKNKIVARLGFRADRRAGEHGAEVRRAAVGRFELAAGHDVRHGAGPDVPLHAVPGHPGAGEDGARVLAHG
jgi:hypothetical protein